MDMQNEQAWLKRMAGRPDETPSLEAVHRMEQGLLQKARRQRTVHKWVRVNSIVGGALAAVVLAVGLLSPGGQSLLHSGSPSDTPAVLQGPEHARLVEEFSKTLAPGETYAGDNGKGTFLIMKDDRELYAKTAGKRKKIMEAPSGAKLQVVTSRDRDLNVAVSTFDDGKPKRLFLVNGEKGTSLEVPLSGATLKMAVAPPTGDDMAVLLESQEGLTHRVLSVNWATGEAKTLFEKTDSRNWGMTMTGEGMIVLEHPQEILCLRNGEWHQIAVSDQGHLSVGSTVNGVLYTLDESTETSVGPYNLNASKVVLYDDKTNQSRMLLPNVSGSQSVLWSSADRTTHILSVFRPLGKTTRFASEQERDRQEGTFELWYVTNGEAKKAYEEQTTFGKSRLTYVTKDGDLYGLKSGMPVEKRFDFDTAKGTVQPVPSASK